MGCCKSNEVVLGARSVGCCTSSEMVLGGRSVGCGTSSEMVWGDFTRAGRQVDHNFSNDTFESSPACALLITLLIGRSPTFFKMSS